MLLETAILALVSGYNEGSIKKGGSHDPSTEAGVTREVQRDPGPLDFSNPTPKRVLTRFQIGQL